jgi:competence protein ComEA
VNQFAEQTSAFVIAILGCLTLSAWFLGADVSVNSTVDVAIPQTINPNHAPLGSLIRLPGVGPARARAIIDFRQTQLEKRPGLHAFHEASDLTKIKGIGPKTVQGLDPWLELSTSCCLPASKQPIEE